MNDSTYTPATPKQSKQETNKKPTKKRERIVSPQSYKDHGQHFFPTIPRGSRPGFLVSNLTADMINQGHDSKTTGPLKCKPLQTSLQKALNCCCILIKLSFSFIFIKQRAEYSLPHQYSKQLPQLPRPTGSYAGLWSLLLFLLNILPRNRVPLAPLAVASHLRLCL